VTQFAKTIVAIFIALQGSSCGQNGKSRSSFSSTGSELNQNVGSGAGDATATRTDAPANLPDYLFSTNQAKAFGPLVLAYEPASRKPEGVAQSPRYENLTSFIEGFLGQAMRLPELSPGRTFDVSMIEAADINASAFNQQLVFNSGLADSVDAISFAFVLCHESAHSTRNHSKAVERLLGSSGLDSPAADGIEKEITAYLNSQVRNNVYFHEAAKYQPLRSRWDQLTRDFSKAQKRLEAEADVIGTKICALLGFDPVAITGAAKSLLGSMRSTTDMDLSKDAQYKIAGITRNDLGLILFPIHSHPTSAERVQQLNLVEPILEKKSNLLASEWQANYKRLAGKSPMALADMPKFGLIGEDGEYYSARRDCVHD
jgi:hypothetical protein